MGRRSLVLSLLRVEHPSSTPLLPYAYHPNWVLTKRVRLHAVGPCHGFESVIF